MLNTPVAFLIFNRPDLTQIVFEAITRAKPKKLLVVADGPRFPEENEKCLQARKVIECVNWNCEILTNFSDVNLGCKKRVSSGLDWVFSQVEEAIILEDDCLPDPSFFDYCAELLERYRNDTRVMAISGDNFQDGQVRTEYSYYFSRYPHVWGWASWRRAWRYYDVEMIQWPQYRDTISLPMDDTIERGYWTNVFNANYSGEIDTWDQQWAFTCFSQHGLIALPNANLVSNLGFRSDATHTTQSTSSAQQQVCELKNIAHPAWVSRHAAADRYTFDHHYGGKELRSCSPIKTLKNRLRPLKRKLEAMRCRA